MKMPEEIAKFKSCKLLHEKQPNKETLAALLEAERITHDPAIKHYSDAEEALQELKR